MSGINCKTFCLTFALNLLTCNTKFEEVFPRVFLQSCFMNTNGDNSSLQRRCETHTAFYERLKVRVCVLVRIVSNNGAFLNSSRLERFCRQFLLARNCFFSGLPIGLLYCRAESNCCWIDFFSHFTIHSPDGIFPRALLVVWKLKFVFGIFREDVESHGSFLSFWSAVSPVLRWIKQLLS